MKKKMSINTFVERFNNGDFDSPSRDVQCEAGWFDWFCSVGSLAAKTKVLGRKVVALSDSKLFDKTKCYVFFKNNCPVVGGLYDSFSICDLETGEVLFCLLHLNKGNHAHWELYDYKVGFDIPVVNGAWNQVKKYFLN